MLDVAHVAANAGYRIYLLGASDGVNQRARTEFMRREPNLQITGYHSGYFQNRDDEQATVNNIISVSPDIVFVGMGALIQERWITRIRMGCRERNVVIPLLMGVGGSFDAITGTVRRPPRWILDLHLEWFFRLLQQPFRAPRMLALPRFAFQVLKSRYLAVHH